MPSGDAITLANGERGEGAKGKMTPLLRIIGGEMANRTTILSLLGMILVVSGSITAMDSFAMPFADIIYDMVVIVFFVFTCYLSYTVYTAAGKDTHPLFYLILVTFTIVSTILFLDLHFQTYRIGASRTVKHGIVAADSICFCAMLAWYYLVKGRTHSDQRPAEISGSRGVSVADPKPSVHLPSSLRTLSLTTSVISVLLFTVLMVLIYMTHSYNMDFMHSSDASNAYYVYKEVVMNGIPFSEIYSNDQKPAMSLPYFLYFLAAILSGNNFYYAQLINAVLQSLLFLAVVLYVLRLFYKKEESTYLFPLVLLFLALALVFLPATSGLSVPRGSFDYELRGVFYPIWMPDYHFVQTAILSLLSFALFLDYLLAGTSARKGFILAAFVTVSMVGGAGEDLFLVVSTLPVLLTALYLWLVKKLSGSDSLLWIVTCLSNLLLQRLMGKAITVSAGALTGYTAVSHIYAVDNVGKIVSMLLGNIMANPLLMAVSFIMFGYSLWVAVFRFGDLRRSPSIDGRAVLAVLLFFAASSNMAVELLSRMVRERYITGVFFCAIVIFVAVFGKNILSFGDRAKPILLACALLFLVYEIAHFGAKEVHGSYYPAEARFIDQIARTYRVTNGIAPYSLAHRNEMTTKSGLTIAPTKDVWLYRFWLSKHDIDKKYNFIVSSDAIINDHNHVDLGSLRKCYGEPDSTERCGDITVYIFKKPFTVQERP